MDFIENRCNYEIKILFKPNRPFPLYTFAQDPKVRAGSVDIMRHWHSLGYLIIYISARPDMQHRQVASWLAQHNFPPGLTFFLDGIFTDPLRQKAGLLKSLIKQVW